MRTDPLTPDVFSICEKAAVPPCMAKASRIFLPFAVDTAS